MEYVVVDSNDYTRVYLKVLVFASYHLLWYKLSLNKTLYPLLSTGSTQEDLHQYDRKIVDQGVKNQIN